jgi:signal transduction histidine kinase/ligand-binding sensor domain-containing protein
LFQHFDRGSGQGKLYSTPLLKFFSAVFHRGVLFVTILVVATVSQAQYRATNWTADSGLPQNIIRGIVQTPDGYLWIATLNGVARFDGVRFTVFDRSSSPGITANRFVAMVAGIQGDLWLYSEGGSIIRYHQGQFHTLSSAEGLATNSVRGITSDDHGHIWALLEEEIFRWDERVSRFERIPNDDEIRYSPLNWDGTGFWGVRGQTLYTFSHGKVSVHSVPSYLHLSEIRKVAVGADGAVWLALPDGRFTRFFNDRWEVHSQPIRTVLQDPSRQSWEASIDSHLDRRLYFPAGGIEESIRYNTIVDDNEHNVWVGSEGQGLFRIQKQTIRVYSVAQGLVGANVYPVLRDAHGDIWAGTWPAGLTQFHHGILKTYTPRDGLPGLVTALADDADGNLWIGTHGGLALLSQGHIQTEKNVPSDLPVVQAILKTKDGLLLGTPDGLYEFAVSRGAQGVKLQLLRRLLTGDVRVIVECRHGDLWVGGYGGLTRLHDGAVSHWTERDGLPSNSVRSVYEDAQGVLWVGTYDGGLGRYADEHWTRFTKDDGLFDNGVSQILEDSHSNLWISSNRGIYRVSKSQLNLIASGGIPKAVFSASYGRSDGMLNVECNGGLWPAGAKDDEGNLWFPTQEGVAVIDTNSIGHNGKPPHVLIESMLIDHAPVNSAKSIFIKPGQSGLEIQYTALSLSKPEQLAFRYRMEGLDPTWEEVGNRRTAYFSHLPPGNYVFRVMAANSDGGWSAIESTSPITVLPPFYLTGRFVSAICVLALLVAYGLWSYRVAQFKHQQAVHQEFAQQLIASQENERRRISAELHDSLGQHLIVIKNLAYFLSRPKTATHDDEEGRQTLEEINNEVSLAIDETRTISYNLRPFQLDRLGLSKAIEALIRSISGATDIRFTTSIAAIDESFPEEQRINFYRIVQEAANNIVKHSGAREAEIRVEKTSRGGVTLFIRDNGKGFTPESRNAVSGKGGFGLTGIQERATLLGGAVKIHSSPGSGTVLTIDFVRG